jgi:hypothetical protein
MKKLILVLCFLMVSLVGFSQVSLWKPIPKDLFYSTKYAKLGEATPSIWLWRFSALLTATELTWDKSSNQFVSAPLSSVGPAIGYKHFTQLADGTPYTDFGINVAALFGTDINQVNPAVVKLAVTVNALKFVNIGFDYGLTNNTFGILLGASVNF